MGTGRVSVQLDLVDACERRDAGIRRAQEHAESDQPGWTETAAEYLRFYAEHRTFGQPFLIEDAASVYTGARPANGKAWGAAVQMAARRGWISKAGAAPARSSNLSLKHLWQAR